MSDVHSQFDDLLANIIIKEENLEEIEQTNEWKADISNSKQHRLYVKTAMFHILDQYAYAHKYAENPDWTKAIYEEHGINGVNVINKEISKTISDFIKSHTVRAKRRFWIF